MEVERLFREDCYAVFNDEDVVDGLDGIGVNLEAFAEPFYRLLFDTSQGTVGHAKFNDVGNDAQAFIPIEALGQPINNPSRTILLP